jgi:hypothetical protein
MLNEGNQIHNFIPTGVCENFCDSILLRFQFRLLTSYGSGSAQQNFSVPTFPVPQHCL